MKAKSPFLVKQEFLSPLQCEDIVEFLEFNVPDTNREGYPIKTTRFHEFSQDLIYNKIEPLIPEIEQYYEIEYAGTEQMVFEWYPEGCSGEEPHSENSEFLRKKWLRTRNRDISGVVFFTDYRDKIPFDNDFEAYGGKLEFPQHQFGFNPQRGTLVLFPSDPHFINNTTSVVVGDLYQVRFHIAAEKPFLYNPEKFPGDYTVWLQEFA